MYKKRKEHKNQRNPKTEQPKKIYYVTSLLSDNSHLRQDKQFNKLNKNVRGKKQRRRNTEMRFLSRLN